MTFGNLGETFEIVAIKSAGIPLLRFMRPLIIVTIFISGIAFLFANNIIPVAQLKLASTKYNIIVSKPSFDIKEGTFYNKIEGFVIRLGKKEKDDSTIRNIVIYKRKYGLQDDIITADIIYIIIIGEPVMGRNIAVRRINIKDHSNTLKPAGAHGTAIAGYR